MSNDETGWGIAKFIVGLSPILLALGLYFHSGSIITMVMVLQVVAFLCFNGFRPRLARHDDYRN